MSSPNDQMYNKSQQRFNSVKEELRIDSTKSGNAIQFFWTDPAHMYDGNTYTRQGVFSSEIEKPRNKRPPE